MGTDCINHRCNKRPIRILHAACSLVDGGAETQLKLLLSNLDREEFVQGVYFLRDDKDFTDREHLQCYRIERGNRWLGVFSVYSQVSRIIDDFRPDLIQLWLPEVMTVPAGIAARLRGIPCISCQRGSRRWAISLSKNLRGTLIGIQHLISGKVISNFPMDQEPNWLRWLIRNKNAQCIPNAVVSRGKENISLELDSWDSTAFNILFVGRVACQKRPEILIEAVAALVRKGLNVRLYLLGEGKDVAYFNKVKKLAEDSLCGRCHLMGYRRDWRSFAHMFSVFAFPTVSEGMPNVMVEAMAEGLPVVATNIPEISWIARDEVEALLVEPDCVDLLEEALSRIALNESLRASIANRGLQRAMEFSLDRMVSSYESVYREMR